MPQLLDRLNEFYREQGIHPLDFRCRFRHVCAEGCGNFTEAKASLVGTRYGVKGAPRLVILSADPGLGFKSSEDRTPEAIRRRSDGLDVARLPKGRHWHETHRLAAEILAGFVPGMVPERAAGHFAHVNAAKCSQNKPGKRQADGKLFRHCRTYLPEELRILDPDIIVSQGGAARKALGSAVGRAVMETSRSCALVRIGEREVFWLRLHHPRAWGRVYGDQCRRWPIYFKRIREWLDEQKRLKER